MPTTTTFRYSTEIIRGVEIEKPLPKKRHALIQKFLLLRLERHLPPAYECLPELNVICSAQRIVPDIVVFKKDAKFLDDDLMDPPSLAIEIASPGQPFSNLLEKCEILAGAGTELCWIILPEARQAWTFDSEAKLVQASGVLQAHPLLLNSLEIPLADIWAALAETA